MRRVRHGFMTHPFFEVVSGSAFIPCIIQIPADLPPARRSGGFAIRRNSKPLSKILFTLHRKVINICSLETCTDEEITSLFTTLHLSHLQCLSGFQPIWRRVKSKKKSGAFIKKTHDVSFCAWQWQVIALVRGNVVP